MSLPLTHARQVAAALRDALAPHCERIEVAGSIRRAKDEVKDVELVCVPRDGGGMFGDERSDGFSEAVRGLGAIVKGDPHTGRYVQLRTAQAVLDLFITDPQRWGWIYLLRTGSDRHNMLVLARLKGNGYRAEEGALWWSGTMVPTPEEADVFKRAGMAFVPPQHRIG